MLAVDSNVTILSSGQSGLITAVLQDCIGQDLYEVRTDTGRRHTNGRTMYDFTLYARWEIHHPSKAAFAFGDVVRFEDGADLYPDVCLVTDRYRVVDGSWMYVVIYDDDSTTTAHEMQLVPADEFLIPAA